MRLFPEGLEMSRQGDAATETTPYSRLALMYSAYSRDRDECLQEYDTDAEGTMQLYDGSDHSPICAHSRDICNI
jgi:hypothetical protein